MQNKLLFDKIENFRDFGGFSTCDGHQLQLGLLFRSGDPDHASKGDIAKLKLLNIRTIIDLRTSKEIKTKPLVLLDAKRIHIPLNITEATRHRLKPYMTKKNSDEQITNAIDSVYSDMVALLKPQVAEILNHLHSSKSYPLLIHCRAGKDRTGFIIAIIHLALHVENKLIIKDYISTNDCLLPGTRRMLKKMRIATLGLISTWNFELASLAQEKFISTVISIIENNHGGIINYLNECGVSQNDLSQIRKNIYVNS